MKLKSLQKYLIQGVEYLQLILAKIINSKLTTLFALQQIIQIDAPKNRLPRVIRVG